MTTVTPNTPIAPFIVALETKRYHYLKEKLAGSADSKNIDIKRWQSFANCCRSLGYLEEAANAFDIVEKQQSASLTSPALSNILRQDKDPVAPATSLGMQPAPFILRDHFLTEDELDKVWQIYHQHINNLRQTRIREGEINTDIRASKSTNLKALLDLDFFKHKVREQLAIAYQYFAMQAPNSSALDLELTTHGDHDFYDVHHDVDLKNPVRQLSYVFYFNQQPKAFDGGELYLYDSDFEKAQYRQHFTCIHPLNNRLVIFPSHFAHQVRPVRLQDTATTIDGRHSLNGWHLDRDKRNKNNLINE